MNKIHWLSLSESRKHPYQLVPSSRAKYVRVKLSNKGELSVVLPRGVAAKHAHEFLKSRMSWVDKHLQNLPLEKEQTRLDNLYLTLLDENWELNYQVDDLRMTGCDIQLIESGEQKLTIIGKVTDLDLIQSVILKWCKQKAKKRFNSMLQQIAQEYGFHYKRLSIRAQKTRWGSCSTQKNINLNCKLLFMPDEIVRYVMIHELCHTIEMNHSSRFWSLVGECDPSYKIHRKQLKELAREIPLQ